MKSDQTFDEDDYLANNPDVSAAVHDGLFNSGLEHYEMFGKREGRIFGLFGKMSREDKALYALDRGGLGLEIGPSHNPIAPKRRGFNVHILDHLCADELREKYATHAQFGVNIENIEEVDFVWAGQSLIELIGQKSYYDWIIASHVIEHVPDLVSFLQQCEALLKPTGRLSLVIPDKRYCFDYFDAVTSTGELLDAFAVKRTRPSAGKVFDHVANATKRGGKIAWGSGESSQTYALCHSLDEARNLWMQAHNDSTYIDVHCWRFTPRSFSLVLADLNVLDLISMNVVKAFDTTGCEFYVTLSRDAEVPVDFDRLEALKKRRLENE